MSAASKAKRFEEAMDSRFFNPIRDGPPSMPSVEELVKPDPSALRVKKQKFAVISYMAPGGAEGTSEERYVPQKSDWVHLKIRGVFKSEAKARDHATFLIAKDPFFDIHIVPLYQWVDIPPRKEPDLEYTQKDLKETMAAVKKTRDADREEMDTRVADAVKKSAADMERMRLIQEEERQRLKAGGDVFTNEEIATRFAATDELELEALERMIDTPATKQIEGYRFGTELSTDTVEMPPLFKETEEHQTLTLPHVLAAATSETACAPLPTPPVIGETLTIPVSGTSGEHEDDQIHVTGITDTSGATRYQYDMPLRQGPTMTEEEFVKRFGISMSDV